MYQQELETAEWGEGVVDQLAQHLSLTLPGLRGFKRRNLFRMRQFYETYAGDDKVTPLVTQMPWTHNLVILTQSRRPEERELYLRMAIQERWAQRELEGQFRQALFERIGLHPPKVSPVVRQIHGADLPRWWWNARTGSFNEVTESGQGISLEMSYPRYCFEVESRVGNSLRS